MYEAECNESDSDSRTQSSPRDCFRWESLGLRALMIARSRLRDLAWLAGLRLTATTTQQLRLSLLLSCSSCLPSACLSSFKRLSFSSSGISFCSSGFSQSVFHHLLCQTSCPLTTCSLGEHGCDEHLSMPILPQSIPARASVEKHTAATVNLGGHRCDEHLRCGAWRQNVKRPDLDASCQVDGTIFFLLAGVHSLCLKNLNTLKRTNFWRSRLYFRERKMWNSTSWIVLNRAIV